MIEDPCPKGVEPPRLDGYVIEEQGIDDDPHPRPSRKDGAVGDGIEGKRGWKAPDRGRNDKPDHEPRQRRLPRRPAQDAEEHENGQDRKRGDDERQRQVVGDRRKQLAKHSAPPERDRLRRAAQSRFLRAERRPMSQAKAATSPRARLIDPGFCPRKSRSPNNTP